MSINVSEYYVSVDLNEDDVIVYSTLSTSIITMPKERFNQIFELKNISEQDEEFSDLEDMGFIFRGEPSLQAEELQKIRKEIVDAEHGITAVTIAPTMSCNARCYYCFEKGAKCGFMTEETADATADFLINGCTEKELYIAWFGGEPLMAADTITRINNRLISAGIKVESTVTTNGILINQQMIENFKKWNVTRVQITIDGISDEYNKVKNYILTIDDPFERIMNNIELVINANISLHLRVNYRSNTYEQVSKTMKYLHDRFGNYDNLYLYGVPLDLPSVKGYSEFDEDEGEIFLRVLDDSLKRGYENEELNFSALRVSEDYNPALGELMLAPFPAPCFMVNRNRYVIDDAGLLYKCQKHLGKSQFSCGNVFTGVTNNSVYQHYVTHRLHDENCVHCNMLPICQGGCNANRLLYGDKFSCPPSKTIIKKLVKRYYEYIMQGDY